MKMLEDILKLKRRKVSIILIWKFLKLRHIISCSLRKHPFLLALRETSPAAKSEEKRMFSQATFLAFASKYVVIPLVLSTVCSTTFLESLIAITRTVIT